MKSTQNTPADEFMAEVSAWCELHGLQQSTLAQKVLRNRNGITRIRGQLEKVDVKMAKVRAYMSQKQ